jgi:hypothetical protein
MTKSCPRMSARKTKSKQPTKKSKDAKIIKLADKTSNLRAITFSPSPNWSVKRRLDYIEWAKSRAVVRRSAPLPPPSGMIICTDPLPNVRVPMRVARADMRTHLIRRPARDIRSMDHFAGLDVSVKDTSVCIVG